MPKSDFKGVIKLDVRDSTPDYEPFMPPRAPAGAPNVLIVLYDDTGLAAWSPYGGRINMPTLDRLAANGLTYSQFHTTALCSPTRSTVLTGRNHHLNGFGTITELADGYPGLCCRLPKECATLGQILQDNGFSTFWLGKNHNVQQLDTAAGGSRSEWPLARGFDRFYGFFGGETNNWYPDLIEDNHAIEQPYRPEDGYHLSKDLADQAIAMLKDQQSSNPSKPWFMWFCPGANHAPHHAPREYADKYKGKFDDGYEAYREWVLQRMIERGILPQGTKLTPINPLPEDIAATAPFDRVRPWNSLSADEKRLFSRMAEVYAGFSEYTDVQIGRIVEYLEKTGQLDNTLIIYAADNGASGEGTPNGSVNENKFFNGYPDELSENMKFLANLGGPDTYNHYPTGWAVAFSSPFQMFKRYSQFAGGTCDPLIIHWPKGIKAKGEIRHQYHHSVDLVPTILEVVGLEMPSAYHGVEQHPLSGISMRYTFDAMPGAPTRKERQYYCMLGTRGLWEKGWKIAALHTPLSGAGHYEKDRWELFHVDEDRSESTDLSAKYPEKVQQLVRAWHEEAVKYNVLPLDDRSVREYIALERPTEEPPKLRHVYYAGTASVPPGVAASLHGRSYKIIADAEITAEASGVIFGHGSRFGGHALFIKDRKLYYVYNFLGIEEQKLVSPALMPGKRVLGIEFVREKGGPQGESFGTARLYVDDKVAATATIRTQPGEFALCGEGFCVGFDGGDSVSQEYEAPARFTGGRLLGVGIDLSEEEYIDVERLAAAILARE